MAGAPPEWSGQEGALPVADFVVKHDQWCRSYRREKHKGKELDPAVTQTIADQSFLNTAAEADYVAQRALGKFNDAGGRFSLELGLGGDHGHSGE